MGYSLITSYDLPASKSIGSDIAWPVAVRRRRAEIEREQTAVDLGYKESKRTDQYGNAFRYRAKVSHAHDSAIALGLGRLPAPRVTSA